MMHPCRKSLVVFSTGLKDLSAELLTRLDPRTFHSRLNPLRHLQWPSFIDGQKFYHGFGPSKKSSYNWVPQTQMKWRPWVNQFTQIVRQSGTSEGRFLACLFISWQFIYCCVDSPEM